MSTQLALSEHVGAYGYGLYQSEIDEYLASDEEWAAIKASIFFLLKEINYYFFRSIDRWKEIR
jgi:hypothetical protein